MNNPSVMRSAADSAGNDKQKEVNIDVKGIFATLVYRWWVIVLVMIVAVLAAYLITSFQKPVYASTAKLYITGIAVNAAESSPNSNTQSTATSIAKSLRDMVTDRDNLLEASHRLAEPTDDSEPLLNADGKPFTYRQMLSMITVSYSTDTPQILVIHSACASTGKSDTELREARENSKRIASMVQEVSAEYLSRVSSTRVNIGNSAGDGDRINDNLFRNLVIAAIIGALVGIIAVLVSFFADDKIKTAEDIEKYLKLSVLGQIPITEKVNEYSSRSTGHRRRDKQKKESGTK